MLVKNRMTSDPVTISPGASYSEAFDLIRESEFRHLPVVDKKGKLVGIVAETDLLHASPSSATTLSIYELNYLLANLLVEEVMSSPAITVADDAPIEQAARIMIDEKVGCLPVVRGHELVGVITETDIFKAFVEVLGGDEVSLRVTLRVADVRGELSRLAGVIAELEGNICSVASFRGEEPGHVYITFRLEGVDEETLIPTLKAGGEEVLHYFCTT
jgi:acetoin utilization protein AcuB